MSMKNDQKCNNNFTHEFDHGVIKFSFLVMRLQLITTNQKWMLFFILALLVVCVRCCFSSLISSLYLICCKHSRAVFFSVAIVVWITCLFVNFIRHPPVEEVRAWMHSTQASVRLKLVSNYALVSVMVFNSPSLDQEYVKRWPRM